MRKNLFHKSLLVRNIFSLSLIQIGNYVFPFVTIPFLTRVLGPENFGLTMFAQTFVSYFTLLINFGFDYTGTREIALNKDNKPKLSEIFSAILTSKILLFLVSGLLVFVLVYSVPYLHKHLLLILATHCVNIGFVLFPGWFFQGVQKLSIAGFFNLLVKLIYTVSVFFVIKSPEDYLLANCLFAGAQIVSGVISLFFCIRRFKIKFSWVNFKEIRTCLSGGITIFLSQLTISLYTSTGIVLLGLYASEKQVGLFSAVFKIWNVIQGMVFIPFALSFFPHISAKYSEAPEEADRQLKKALSVLVSITLISTVGIYFFAEKIIFIVFGSGYSEAVVLLKTASLLPVIIAVSNIYGMQGLIPLRADKSFLFITTLAGVTSIILNLIFIPRTGMYGTAIIWVLTEVMISVLCYYYYRKKLNERLKIIHEGV